jgi:hypothetical protein
MRDPSEELSVRLGSKPDGPVEQSAGSKLRANLDLSRGSNRTGRNLSECRAGLESEVAVAEPPTNGRRPMRMGRKTEVPHSAAGVVATEGGFASRARTEGFLRNVRGPIGCPWETGGERRERRRAGRESDRPIVPVKRVMTAEGRGLTFGVLVKRTRIAGRLA